MTGPGKYEKASPPYQWDDFPEWPMRCSFTEDGFAWLGKGNIALWNLSPSSIQPGQTMPVVDKVVEATPDSITIRFKLKRSK